LDLSYPPYGGTDKDREAGIDVDVASAIASALNLDLQLIEVAAEDAPAALKNGSVDMVMSVPFTEDAVIGATFAGWYIESGPALFASVDTSVTPADLGKTRVASQKGSEAYWRLTYTLGEEAVVTTETLREAFDALQTGDVDVVAGDALVGAYLSRDFEGIGFASQLGPATPIGIVVSTEATELESEIRQTLDSLAAGGVLDAIRAKWVDDLPALDVSTGEQ
jgi:polar amino acid transport system substrate-binding protein